MVQNSKKHIFFFFFNFSDTLLDHKYPALLVPVVDWLDNTSTTHKRKPRLIKRMEPHMFSHQNNPSPRRLCWFFQVCRFTFLYQLTFGIKNIYIVFLFNLFGLLIVFPGIFLIKIFCLLLCKLLSWGWKEGGFWKGVEEAQGRSGINGAILSDVIDSVDCSILLPAYLAVCSLSWLMWDLVLESQTETHQGVIFKPPCQYNTTQTKINVKTQDLIKKFVLPKCCTWI